MTDDRKQYGHGSEAAAARHLAREGYKILERNHRNRLGEIDIIARHKGVWVFVEVKARRGKGFGDPKWAVTPAKQRKLSMVALAYLKHIRALEQKARFDVVTVVNDGDMPRFEVIANAFELAYP
ncbi:MAG: YraN family protein [Desulfatitalea sp.]|nr:YraN family protein [Desulfatitalea sp.]NNJ99550.1 YraN family protein [Desulfatitalea sp.]